MKIFLSGYMGSGKTAVAKLVSQKFGFSLIDMDDQISLIEQQAVVDIFKNKGELYFRKRETQVLEDILEDPNSLVIALGGGTPCYGANLELIKNYPESKIVYLKASVGFLTNRLFTEKNSRPVISHLESKTKLEEFVRKHLFERSFFYNQADIVVGVEQKSPDEIAKEIFQKLN